MWRLPAHFLTFERPLWEELYEVYQTVLEYSCLNINLEYEQLYVESNLRRSSQERAAWKCCSRLRQLELFGEAAKGLMTNRARGRAYSRLIKVFSTEDSIAKHYCTRAPAKHLVRVSRFLFAAVKLLMYFFMLISKMASAVQCFVELGLYRRLGKRTGSKQYFSNYRDWGGNDSLLTYYRQWDEQNYWEKRKQRASRRDLEASSGHVIIDGHWSIRTS